MAGTAEVLSSIEPVIGTNYSVLVPNQRGMDDVLRLLSGDSPPPVTEIAVFTAATDGFAKANTNVTIAESLARLAPVVRSALDAGLRVRGYVSVIITCPYAGRVDPRKVRDVSRELLQMGCYEVSLGDTTGAGTPASVRAVLEEVTKDIDISLLAGHFHDTNGTALANIQTALGLGMRTFDASVGGLGGCPYSPGATGNVATEDVVYGLTGEHSYGDVGEPVSDTHTIQGPIWDLGPISLASLAETVADDDAAEGSTSHTGRPQSRPDADTDSTPGGRKKLTKEQKKAQRGANKGRRFGKVRDELELCWRIANGTICEHGTDCRFTHDVGAYLSAKPRDIRFPPASALRDTPPFVVSAEPLLQETETEGPSLDFGTTCVCFEEAGECRVGLKCRYLGAHAHRDENGAVTSVVDEEKKSRIALTTTELNHVSPETLKMIRTKKYPTPISDAYLKEAEASGNTGGETDITAVQDDATGDVTNEHTGDIVTKRTGDTHFQVDTPDVPMRFSEKKRLHWTGKTYLAPLTTVGNLPFRRLCVSLGADITCGEMGLATSFLNASREEWSLVRRHPSESIFGIQLAGNKATTMVPTAEILGKEFASGIDFVDINCGCPIDLVFRTGSGSALLDAPGKLGKMIVGMSKALGEIPVTVKLRTGVKDGRNTAHKLMPRLSSDWGAGCITLHGRTRQQRYTKLADWDYIRQCVEAVRARETNEGLAPVPIFGGGDCFSSQDYWEKIEGTGVDGIMIGRGALIKPWLFTEIKEHREWDISSRERLEHIRKLAEYGLSHFGTDTAGVNTTRRYLCEALSFQYRYIPIGLLERLPARINERAPAFKGRDELGMFESG
ncbi:hypothetical protein ID866_5498 [Astraeus odoratus]|nr:hypothetical protein ID866_5498 [Astraeus odoratus]